MIHCLRSHRPRRRSNGLNESYPCSGENSEIIIVRIRNSNWNATTSTGDIDHGMGDVQWRSTNLDRFNYSERIITIKLEVFHSPTNNIFTVRRYYGIRFYIHSTHIKFSIYSSFIQYFTNAKSSPCFENTVIMMKKIKAYQSIIWDIGHVCIPWKNIRF